MLDNPRDGITQDLRGEMQAQEERLGGIEVEQQQQQQRIFEEAEANKNMAGLDRDTTGRPSQTIGWTAKLVLFGGCDSRRLARMGALRALLSDAPTVHPHEIHAACMSSVSAPVCGRTALDALG